MCVKEEAEGMAFVCEIDVVCPSKYVAILLKRLVTDIQYAVFWMLTSQVLPQKQVSIRTPSSPFGSNYSLQHQIA